MEAAIHWSGPVLLCGALILGVGILQIALRPVIDQRFSAGVATLLLVSAALLLVSLPGLYAAQAEVTGTLGLAAHVLLATGLLLLVVVSATPLLYPTVSEPPGESIVVFSLGICLALGLLLTGVATLQAEVFPRPAAALLLAGTVGFFFVFFVAEFLPPIAGQIGAAVCGIMLALGFAWIGVALWLRT